GAFLYFPNLAFAQEQDADTADQAEEIIVQATRSGRRVQDEPVRVEVVNREEIEEKILMRPGNVAMILSETGGLRIQVTAPALGAANVRVQGMDGRFTSLLADGLPLYGQSSALGLLQVAPTDLGQVEVIKGAASALYGPSALGGVINLVSRRPRDFSESELLFNATSRNGQDLTGYHAAPIGEGLAYSVTGGLHHQKRQDLDEDGWTDMAHYERWTVRPRFFWEGEGGAKAYLTIGAMTEQRDGGTLPGRTVPDGTPFPQAQDSRRFDAGLTAEIPVEGLGKVQLRLSGVTQKHDHLFGDSVEDDRHRTLFAEASLAGGSGGTSWLGGVAFQADRFRSARFVDLDYSYSSPAVFVQGEQDLGGRLTLAGSARVDVHSDYGTHLSPRLSLLHKPGPWTIRASIGRGFYAPTPFVEEIEEAGLSRLRPLRGLNAETATTGSFGVGYARGPIEANVTAFASDVDDAVQLRAAGPAEVELVNAAGKSRTRGAEVMLRYRWRAMSFTGSYVHVDAREADPSGIGRRTVPRTPHHSAGFVAMWEKHGRGRIGFEAYYTGRQQLDDNPYRTRSKPYVEMGLLGEIVLGSARLFVNAENILDVRQSKYDPLLLPARAIDGRWTVDAWAPTDGFVVNAGVRLSFGGD
ncbi:MAG: TonB-dependent receptor, partial [Rhizorhabdus sp.]